MNDLSWFLYFADTAESFSRLLDLVAFFGCVTGLVGLLAYMMSMAFGSEMALGPEDVPVEARVMARKIVIGAASICTASAIAAAAIPSKQTFYMIAASEIGGAVVTTPEAKAIMADLQTLIRRELAEALSQRQVRAA